MTASRKKLEITRRNRLEELKDKREVNTERKPNRHQS
jgi:hypothetical protein